MRKLYFNENGEFTILQIADLHGEVKPEETDLVSIRRAVELSKPDVIIMTGDNVSGYACPTKAEARTALKNTMNLLESIGVPVAMVFGNHDDDRTEYTKHDQLEQYKSYSCFIGREGVTASRDIDGRHTDIAGNYDIPVYASEDSSEIAFNLWMFDSGGEHPDPKVDSYGYVFPEIVEWYDRRDEELKALNGGKTIPSMVFQHICPPHIVRALKKVPEGTKGAVKFSDGFYTLPDDAAPETNRLREAPCPPNCDLDYAYAQVDRMLERGGVRAIFFGHDHVNTFRLNYSGIDLVCSPGCGENAYHDESRGFRVIKLNKNNLNDYETHILRTSALITPNAPADA